MPALRDDGAHRAPLQKLLKPAAVLQTVGEHLYGAPDAPEFGKAVKALPYSK